MSFFETAISTLIIAVSEMLLCPANICYGLYWLKKTIIRV